MEGSDAVTTNDTNKWQSDAGSDPHGAFRRRFYTRHDTPLFFAHRGGSLLAPENTLPAFDRGVSLGADALELDIQVTRDGELVVIHDPLVDRTTNATGSVAGYTFDELRALDAGYHFTPDGGQSFPYRGQGITIPTLREVYERYPDKRINIDLKANDPERGHKLWQLIQEQQAEDRTMIGSFEHAPMLRFRRLTGGRVGTSATRREIATFLAAAACRSTSWLRPAYDALQVPETHRGLRIVSPLTIGAAHRLGLDVHVWTIDDRATMERLLAWGVDGLMTDRPDILAEVVAKRV